eukprot:5728384-Pyramimonas_sp.AAC.2
MPLTSGASIRSTHACDKNATCSRAPMCCDIIYHVRGYLYLLGEWNPRVWDKSEVYNPMYRDARLV